MIDLAANIDLGSLSHSELADLARLLSEQESALNDNRLELYQPHAGQLAFHKSRAIIRMLITGNRYGKTTASVIEAIWLALGTHPYHKITVPNRGKMYGESFPTIDETLRLKFEEWLPRKFLSNKKPFVHNQMGHLIGVNFQNGSMIRIGSYDQEE